MAPSTLRATLALFESNIRENQRHGITRPLPSHPCTRSWKPDAKASKQSKGCRNKSTPVVPIDQKADRELHSTPKYHRSDPVDENGSLRPPNIGHRTALSQCSEPQRSLEKQVKAASPVKALRAKFELSQSNHSVTNHSITSLPELILIGSRQVHSPQRDSLSCFSEHDGLRHTFNSKASRATTCKAIKRWPPPLLETDSNEVASLSTAACTHASHDFPLSKYPVSTGASTLSHLHPQLSNAESARADATSCVAPGSPVKMMKAKFEKSQSPASDGTPTIAPDAVLTCVRRCPTEKPKSVCKRIPLSGEADVTSALQDQRGEGKSRSMIPPAVSSEPILSPEIVHSADLRNTTISRCKPDATGIIQGSEHPSSLTSSTLPNGSNPKPVSSQPDAGRTSTRPDKPTIGPGPSKTKAKKEKGKLKKDGGSEGKSKPFSKSKGLKTKKKSSDEANPRTNAKSTANETLSLPATKAKKKNVKKSTTHSRKDKPLPVVKADQASRASKRHVDHVNSDLQLSFCSPETNFHFKTMQHQGSSISNLSQGDDDDDDDSTVIVEFEFDDDYSIADASEAGSTVRFLRGVLGRSSSTDLDFVVDMRSKDKASWQNAVDDEDSTDSHSTAS